MKKTDIVIQAVQLEAQKELRSRAVEIISKGEWPDSKFHGAWRVGNMLNWLSDQGIVLTIAPSDMCLCGHAAEETDAATAPQHRYGCPQRERR